MSKVSPAPITTQKLLGERKESSFGKMEGGGENMKKLSLVLMIGGSLPVVKLMIL